MANKVRLIKVHPIILNAAMNSGMLRSVLLSHRGTFQISLKIMAAPVTPPVTMLAGSKMFLIPMDIRTVPITIIP